MYHLTGNPSPDYTAATANKTLAGGFSSPNGQDNGALAPSNSFLGVFFVYSKASQGSPLVVCEGDSSESPAIAVGVHRSTNPSHAATILFSSFWCQLVLDQTQDTNMTHSIFKLREDSTPSQLSNFLYENAIKSQALNDVLGEHLSNRSELSGHDYYNKMSSLQWALASLLEQQLVVCDQLVMQRITCGELKVGEVS